MSSFPNEIQTYKLVIYGLPAPNLNPRFLSLFIVLLHNSYHPWIALPPRSPHSIWNPSSHSHLMKYYVSLKISSKNTFPLTYIHLIYLYCQKIYIEHLLCSMYHTKLQLHDLMTTCTMYKGSFVPFLSAKDTQMYEVKLLPLRCSRSSEERQKIIK